MKRFIFLAAGLLVFVSLQAEKTPIDGLHSYRLNNGLEVFVLENHVVPLTRIQITFRCGAIAQKPETAGLFHLYEHMLFKGNLKYKTETDFSNALTELGVAEWNGGTSSEYVTYYITVPSDKTEAGLEFWSYALREPLLDAEELKIEKDVVCNEINGYLANSDHVFRSAVSKNLFSKYPWRRDVGGSEQIIRSANVETLREMKSNYYIPNNAAIFIGGDIEPRKALAMVRKWYGSWKRAADPWKMPLPRQALPGVKEPVFLVYPDDSLVQGLAYIQLIYRGPDVLRETEATYAADVWGSLIDSPAGRFKNAVFEKTPLLYDKQYISGSYFTQRDGGEISFGSYTLIDPKMPVAVRAKESFIKAILDETESIVKEKAYFLDEDFDIVKRRLGNEQVFNLETPEHFIEMLSFWWSTASTDYFFSYAANMKKILRSDITSFLKQYILSNVPILAIRINPADYEVEKNTFDEAGFIKITTRNAFWWGNIK